MTSNKLHVALGFGNEVRITRGRSFLQKTKRNHKTPTQFLLIDYRPGRRNALQRNQYGAPGNERANFQRDTSVRVFAEVARVHSFGNRVDFTVIHSAWYLLRGNSQHSPNICCVATHSSTHQISAAWQLTAVTKCLLRGNSQQSPNVCCVATHSTHQISAAWQLTAVTKCLLCGNSQQHSPSICCVATHSSPQMSAAWQLTELTKYLLCGNSQQHSPNICCVATQSSHQILERAAVP
jgi:hypothetical protein